MLDLLHLFAKERKIFEYSYRAEDVTEFIEKIKEKGFVPILLIDELQVMYPNDKHEKMAKESLEIKKHFIANISQLSGEGKTLIICAGSMTLIDKAFRHRSDDSRISDYIELNDEKMKPIYLLPILDKEEFQKSLKSLNLKID